jgi:hypothetical protein
MKMTERETISQEWCSKLPKFHLADIHLQLIDLLHHRNSTIGSWATDRPDLLTDEEKAKYSLFEIK